jgi:gliding motility-associated protein GldM
MAQGKQTPRQKMINLMYLVFIAMMALNIDAEIIRSYYDSTRALNETRTLTEKKNEKIFEKTLEAKAQQVPDTYAQPWEQYKVLKGKIDLLVSSAQGIKDALKKQSDFHDRDPKTGKEIDVSENFAALNNNEATTEYFFKEGDENAPSKGALELKAKIDDVRNYINATFGSNAQLKDLVDRANKSLIAEYPKGKSPNDKTWFQNKFYHQPLIAAISNLEIIQNDARNVQTDALA